MRKCPYCAEEIRDEAIKCKHCGSDVPPAGQAIITHQGQRYVIGYDQARTFYAAWDRAAPGEPVRRYPHTQEGWAEAWRDFSASEPQAAGQTTVRPEKPTNVWTVLAIATGVVGFLILPIIFGPLAVIFGVVGISQGSKPAWIGVVLGAIAVIVVAIALNNLSNSIGLAAFMGQACPLTHPAPSGS